MCSITVPKLCKSLFINGPQNDVELIATPTKLPHHKLIKPWRRKQEKGTFRTLLKRDYSALEPKKKRIIHKDNDHHAGTKITFLGSKLNPRSPRDTKRIELAGRSKVLSM